MDTSLRDVERAWQTAWAELELIRDILLSDSDFVGWDQNMRPPALLSLFDQWEAARETARQTLKNYNRSLKRAGLPLIWKNRGDYFCFQGYYAGLRPTNCKNIACPHCSANKDEDCKTPLSCRIRPHSSRVEKYSKLIQSLNSNSGKAMAGMAG